MSEPNEIDELGNINTHTLDIPISGYQGWGAPEVPGLRISGGRRGNNTNGYSGRGGNRGGSYQKNGRNGQGK